MVKITESQRIKPSNINDDTLSIKTTENVVIDGDLSLDSILICEGANVIFKGDLEIDSYISIENVNMKVEGEFHIGKYLILSNCELTVAHNIITDEYMDFYKSSVVSQGNIISNRSISLKVINSSQNFNVGNIISESHLKIRDSNAIKCNNIDSGSYTIVKNTNNLNCNSINSGMYLDIESSTVNVNGKVYAERRIKSSDRSILNAKYIDNKDLRIHDTSEINSPSLIDKNEDSDDSKNSKNEFLNKSKKNKEEKNSIDGINKDTLVQCIIFKFKNVPINNGDFSNIMQGYKNIGDILQEIDDYHDVKEISQSDKNNINFSSKDLDKIKAAYNSKKIENEEGFCDMLDNNSLTELIESLDENQEDGDKEKDDDIYEEFI